MVDTSSSFFSDEEEITSINNGKVKKKKPRDFKCDVGLTPEECQLLSSEKLRKNRPNKYSQEWSGKKMFNCAGCLMSFLLGIFLGLILYLVFLIVFIRIYLSNGPTTSPTFEQEIENPAMKNDPLWWEKIYQENREKNPKKDGIQGIKNMPFFTPQKNLNIDILANGSNLQETKNGNIPINTQPTTAPESNGNNANGMLNIAPALNSVSENQLPSVNNQLQNAMTFPNMPTNNFNENIQQQDAMMSYDANPEKPNNAQVQMETNPNIINQDNLNIQNQVPEVRPHV